MNITKTKKGFSTIKLLIVIGIIAVLSAIAIPTTIGILNKAKEVTNTVTTSDMNNAIEQFIFEYHGYTQNISSSNLNINNMNASQSRVQSVVIATSSRNIKELESSSGYSGRKLDNKTKFPENIATIKALLNAYLSSAQTSIFEPQNPKQSFFYNPDFGIIICTETNKSVAELNEVIVNESNIPEINFNENSKWINLTTGETINDDNFSNPNGGGENGIENKFIFEENMTWEQWLNSKYNNSGYIYAKDGYKGAGYYSIGSTAAEGYILEYIEDDLGKKYSFSDIIQKDRRYKFFGQQYKGMY